MKAWFMLFRHSNTLPFSRTPPLLFASFTRGFFGVVFVCLVYVSKMGRPHGRQRETWARFGRSWLGRKQEGQEAYCTVHSHLGLKSAPGFDLETRTAFGEERIAKPCMHASNDRKPWRIHRRETRWRLLRPMTPSSVSLTISIVLTLVVGPTLFRKRRLLTSIMSKLYQKHSDPLSSTWPIPFSITPTCSVRLSLLTNQISSHLKHPMAFIR